MTIKELKKYFKVQRVNNYYLLYDLDLPGKRLANKYIGQVFKVGKKFYVNGYEPSNSIDVLKTQLSDYEFGLGFDIEYFHPLYRNGITEEYIIHDYLVKCGFKLSSQSESYYIEINNGFDQLNKMYISFSGLDAYNIKPIIDMNIHISDWKWATMSCKREVNDIIKMIDNYLTIVGLTFSSNGVQLISNNFTDIELTLNSLNQDNLKISKSDFKQELIIRLKQTIKILEQNENSN